MEFEEQYVDVLQNIEFAIIGVYRNKPEITDYDAQDAIDALVRFYSAEEQKRNLPSKNLYDLAQPIFDSVKSICEFRLGRETLSTSDNQLLNTIITPITLNEIIACLKRIQKSIRRWNKRGGKRGYLDFVKGYIK